MDDQIERQLIEQDSALAPILDAVIAHNGNVERLATSAYATHFEALARSIVFQQLSGKAAGTIYGRLLEGIGGEMCAERLIAVPEDRLRSYGLSQGKAKYLAALAAATQSGQLVLEGLEERPDEEIMETLTQLPGIGIWTVQMFLMFRLRRPDILPSGDLGVRKGFALLTKAKKLPTPAALERRGRKWKPWRSIVSLYLWRVLDTDYEPQ